MTLAKSRSMMDKKPVSHIVRNFDLWIITRTGIYMNQANRLMPFGLIKLGFASTKRIIAITKLKMMNNASDKVFLFFFMPVYF